MQSSGANPTAIPPDLPLPQLEQLLSTANLGLSSVGTPQALAAVRSYFTGPNSAYQLLAISCLKIVGENRLHQIVYLDMVDNKYTKMVGADHYVLPDGSLDLPKVAIAIVQSYNEYYSQNVQSLTEILELRN